MDNTESFYDFCIPYNKDEKVMKAMITELVELGYKTIAIEQTFDHNNKNNVKRASDIFPEPPGIKYLQEEFKNKIKILQRLTIIYVDGAVTHAMVHIYFSLEQQPTASDGVEPLKKSPSTKAKSLNLKKYNIVAGQPKTDAALTHCCTAFGGDLLTFDPDAGGKLLVNRKAFQIAVKRGMFFEIKYSLAIRDSNNRKDMIKIAHNYCVRGKSKNIIFSSGAKNVFELRGPYDVANLAFIFGLSEDQGKNAIDRFCRQLFVKAESRRVGKTIMFVKSLGPIVFSDSSDDGAFDTTEQKESYTQRNEECETDEFEEQPNKKKKKVC